MRIMIEASGSLVSGYLIKAIQEAGHTAVASDIDVANHGTVLADDFIKMPRVSAPDLWQQTEELLSAHGVDIVVPSLDETLVGWAERREHFSALGIHIILSDAETVAIFQDKWRTYEFFRRAGIPTPATSLTQDHWVVKPRLGRGGKGIYMGDVPQDMTDMISQEFIKGTEYTCDCFFDRNNEPVYIVPRKRDSVVDGKSLKGITVRHERIDAHIRRIGSQIPLRGPVNFQCIETAEGELFFIECNPRIAGGMALGFAASENWIALIASNIVRGEDVTPKPVRYDLRMVRYYAECFIPA
ncbi:ATP-grasp domain-containing protein (plasmid) [Ensifer adhaerens]|uniref:ATP-grasp domain-containing protein n=1 Tax=Ensifer adhaerens TaxID=106592 RepID=UPI002100CF97|nr:ATP-grasp domain-containing protein [Ensifer adhaerens]UTV39264.1 ATP-grasp domain-containing protein [Ensifer adhaerens]